MNSVGKTRVPIISKPEELHAKGFISDAQLAAASSKDSKKISKANMEALALYTLEDFGNQNPMTSNQTDTIKNAKGLSSRQTPLNGEKQSEKQESAITDLIKGLETDGYTVVAGLPGQTDCMIISALKSFGGDNKPDLKNLYSTHRQCEQRLKSSSTTNMDGTEDTEGSDTIVASSDNDDDNIPVKNDPKKAETVSHAAEVEALLVKLTESKSFKASDMYVTLYKLNLNGERVTYTIGTPGTGKSEIILIHCGDHFDAAMKLSTSTTV